MNKLILPSLVIALLVGSVLVMLTSGESFLALPAFGEEGFAPYDPLLDNSYSPALWGEPAGTAAGGSGDFLYYTDARQAAGFETRPLFLEDFKADYVVTKPTISGDTLGTVTLVLVQDGVVVSETALLIGRDGAAKRSGQIQVVYNDLANEEFQVFLDTASSPLYQGAGSLVLRFKYESFNAASGYGYTTSIMNPRIKSLFGCDPQENEDIVTACVAGPELLTRDELPRWVEGESRFCLELGASRVQQGLGSGSSRVYYELAQNNALPIEEDEAWFFTYITPGSGGDITLTSACGSVSVDDVADIEPMSFLSGPKTITWQAAAGDSEDEVYLRSGDFVLFETFKPAYSGQSIDAHTPEGDRISYPSPGEEYWETVLSYSNRNYFVREHQSIGPFSVERVGLSAVYSYGPEHGHAGRVVRDEWQTTYKIVLEKDYFTLDNAVVSGDDLILTIGNEWADATASIAVIFRPDIINQPFTTAEIVSIPSGGRVVSVPLPNDFDTSYDYDISLGLLTDAGVIDASVSSSYSYVDDNFVTKKNPWYMLFWEWIKGWFA